MTQPTTTPAEIEALCKRLELEATAWPSPASMGDMLREAAAKLREMAGALAQAAPLIETLDSLVLGTAARKTTWKALKDIRAALAGGSHG